MRTDNTPRPESQITDHGLRITDHGSRPRIGVFVCHCGHNIAGTVDVARVAEELGRRIVANVVMLGALAALWPAISKEAMLSAIVEAVPPHTRDLNKKAFEAGVRYAEENIHES